MYHLIFKIHPEKTIFTLQVWIIGKMILQVRFIKVAMPVPGVIETGHKSTDLKVVGREVAAGGINRSIVMIKITVLPVGMVYNRHKWNNPFIAGNGIFQILVVGDPGHIAGCADRK